MILLVKLFSIVVIIYGCLLILKPGILKVVFEYAKKKNRVYVAGGVKALVGVVLVIAASSCEIPWIVFFLGALCVFGGAATFLLKKTAVVQMMEWVEKKPDWHVYLVGAIALAIGVLLALAV
jgi:uncharacterized membrane protein HdeD (DUF308 family)